MTQNTKMCSSLRLMSSLAKFSLSLHSLASSTCPRISCTYNTSASLHPELITGNCNSSSVKKGFVNFNNILKQNIAVARTRCSSLTSTFQNLKFSGLSQCWIDLLPWQWQVYMTLVSVVLFLVPALIIGGCYTVIVWTIWSKSKLLITSGHLPMRRQSECQFQHESVIRRKVASINMNSKKNHSASEVLNPI